jgi:DNA helicase HerA-like ATPase
MMLIIEEAHNYCPEKGFGKTVSTDIMRTIASEGRKFGLGMMVISQRPARIDKNVLSQCNTQIVLKVTNPNDLQAIRKGLEGISVEAEAEIKRLPPGVAMIVSGDIERPIVVEIRARKSRHGGKSASVIERKPLSEGQRGGREREPLFAPEKRGEVEERVSATEQKPLEGKKTSGLFAKVFGTGKT